MASRLGGGFQGSLTGYDNARFIVGSTAKSIGDSRFRRGFQRTRPAAQNAGENLFVGHARRLAFALSLAIEFDCYLIDEVIMVGEQTSTRNAITSYSRSGGTGRWASHPTARTYPRVLQSGHGSPERIWNGVFRSR